MIRPDPSEEDIKLYRTDPVLHAAVHALANDIIYLQARMTINHNSNMEDLINVCLINLARYHKVLKPF